VFDSAFLLNHRNLLRARRKVALDPRDFLQARRKVALDPPRVLSNHATARLPPR